MSSRKPSPWAPVSFRLGRCLNKDPFFNSSSSLCLVRPKLSVPLKNGRYVVMVVVQETIHRLTNSGRTGHPNEKLPASFSTKCCYKSTTDFIFMMFENRLQHWECYDWPRETAWQLQSKSQWGNIFSVSRNQTHIPICSSEVQMEFKEMSLVSWALTESSFSMLTSALFCFWWYLADHRKSHNQAL